MPGVTSSIRKRPSLSKFDPRLTKADALSSLGPSRESSSRRIMRPFDRPVQRPPMTTRPMTGRPLPPICTWVVLPDCKSTASPPQVHRWRESAEIGHDRTRYQAGAGNDPVEREMALVVGLGVVLVQENAG